MARGAGKRAFGVCSRHAVQANVRKRRTPEGSKRVQANMTHQRNRVRVPTRLAVPADSGRKLTHYLFKYPAKFHPPIANLLIQKYSKPGDTVLDPFCGSGSLLVEAAVAGRTAIGTDIDPVAVFVSRVKTQRRSHTALSRSADLILFCLGELARPDSEYARRQFDDIQPATADRVIRGESLPVPSIPNIDHWFRQYVIVDLGRILRTIESTPIPASHRDFFRLCFGSIIRASSNADPVPVSGLEVTAHMKRKDAAGRVINPFALFAQSVHRGLTAVKEYSQYAKRQSSSRVLRADATELASRLRVRVDAIITSPPYNVAVDYYRRHQLEMFWLGLTKTHNERLKLLPCYIGRGKVAQSHPFVSEGVLRTPLVKTWERTIRAVSPERADAFKHYAVAMARSFREMTRLLKPDGKAVLIVGKSSWNGKVIPTGNLLVELAGKKLELVEHLWYPVSNRYMSYSRHNGASIDREYVLVFRRARSKSRSALRAQLLCAG